MESRLSYLVDQHNLQVSKSGKGDRLTQAKLAKKSGVNANTINRLFHNSIDRFDGDTIEKICRTLECEIGDLLVFGDKSDWESVPADLMDEAIDAWTAYCEERNYVYQQPSRSLSVANTRSVVLKNVNGKLGRYSLKHRRILDSND